MKLARRGFLKLLPAAGFAGKLAAEDAAKQLSGLGSTGFPQNAGGGWAVEGLGCAPNQPAPISLSQGSAISIDARRRIIQRVLRIPKLRGELESILYEDQRHVGYIDPDLAAKRSFSLAAKVTFQRQRNVERALQNQVYQDSPYQQVERWTERVLKWVW